MAKIVIELDTPGVNECWLNAAHHGSEAVENKRPQLTRRRLGVIRVYQAITFVLSAYFSNPSAFSLLGQPIPSPIPDWKSLSHEAQYLQPAPGLIWQLWAAEPQLANGVSFCFDREGRCYIAETHRYGRSIFDITQQPDWLTNDLSFRTATDRREFLEQTFHTNRAILTADSELIRRVQDSEHAGHATESIVAASGFNSVLDGTAAGILAAGTNLWFGNIPNLWRIDVNSDSPMKRVIATGFGVHIGVTGHDLHGLTRGPDGRLYMSFGDRGVCLTNQEGQVIYLPDTGGVLRCLGDGSHLEIYCTGLRNPQEIAFDDQGNLWTVDNDTAGEDPCRVLYLLQGADYGWRCSYQHQEGFGPWVQEELWKGYKEGILPPVGTVSQGPSGLAWYPGTGFGNRLAGRFLHCDFPQGVLSFSVEPSGAGFKIGHADRFLWNCWATDVDFGPDGAAYILDWVHGWQMPNKGRIYRVIDPQFIDRPDMEEVRGILKAGMEHQKLDDLVGFLGHRDRRIRIAAQSEWVGRNPESREALFHLASSTGPLLGRIHALWTLSELNRSHPPVTDLSPSYASIAQSLENSESEFVGQALFLLAQDSPELLVNAVQAAIHRSEARLDLQVTLALGEALQSNRAILLRNIMQAEDFRTILRHILLAHLGDAWIEHGVVMALAAWDAGTKADDNHELTFWLTNENSAIRRVGLLAARHQAQVATQQGKPLPDVHRVAELIIPLLDDTDPRLVEEAGRAIYELPLAPAFPALAKLLTRIDLPAALETRVIQANLRLGAPQFAQAVASFALRQDASPRARAKALEALGEWGHPSPIDRVNGLWHPMVQADRESNSSDPANLPANSGQEKGDVGATSVFPAARFPMGHVAPLPIDLGRSASYETGIAVKRSDAAARRAFLRVAGQILDPFLPDPNGVIVGGPIPPEEVQVAVIRAAGALHLKEASHPLADHFHSTGVTSGTKEAILEVLVTLNAAETQGLIEEALDSPIPELRTTAIACLSQLNDPGSVDLLGQIVRDALSSMESNLRAAQAALGALGNISNPESKAVLVEFLARMQNGRWPDSLALDLLDSISRRRDEDLDRKVSELPVNLEKLPGKESWGPWLSGGNSQRGAKIFRENQTVQCSRCHRVGNEGGTVGPPLDGIGKRASRIDILESIAFPNAKIAPGFESVVLRLKSGRQVVGTLRRESPEHLEIESQLEDGQLETNRVAIASIDARQRSPSAMPEGLDKALSALELRDLVEYLSSLR